MNWFRNTTIQRVSLTIVTLLSTQWELTIMGQDVKYPTADSLKSPLGPPLIDVAAAESRYHEALFEAKFGLPRIEDIDEIKAELYQCTGYGSPLAPFQVPREFFPKIMAFFRGAIIDPLPMFVLPETGTLMIRTKDGSVRRICWYGAIKAPLRFSLHGARCVAPKRHSEPVDEAYQLDHLIRKAYEKANTK